MNKLKINFLYTNIGRGHPFYLDGIVEEMNRGGSINLVRSTDDVFSVSRGLSSTAWKFVRFLYHQGAQDSFISKIYSQLRKNNTYNNDSLIQKILAIGIRKKYFNDLDPLVVAHPLLVSILKDRDLLYYQHGEVVTPQEAVVKGAAGLFVPTELAAEPFLQYYDKSQIVVTGLCLEPSLTKIAADCFSERIKRIEEEKHLTGGFFSSGAEPKRHLELLIKSVNSFVDNNGKAILFVKAGGMFESALSKVTNINGKKSIIININDEIPYEFPRITIVRFQNRREENILVTRLFHQLDFFMSPAHERTNWAVGLGLPIFICEPSIGPFAPLNRAYILKSETGLALTEMKQAVYFFDMFHSIHQSGQLRQMALNGWQKEEIDGFKKIVDILSNLYGEDSLH